MNKGLWIGKKGYRYWYYNFRDSEYYSITLIGVVIILSLYLLFTFIIPETSQWFSIRKEVLATRQNIAILQQNINLMNSLDKNVLNTQLQTASQALPPEKNFSSMLNAVTSAAAISGVSLNDYSFPVGNIDVGQTQSSGTINNGVSSTIITVVVNGNINNISKFINALDTSVPLSEITSINGSQENVSITMQFYQKQFPPIPFSGETPIAPLSSNKVALLQKLAKWENTATTQTSQNSSNSGSVVPLF